MKSQSEPVKRWKYNEGQVTEVGYKTGSLKEVQKEISGTKKVFLGKKRNM